LLLLLLLLLLLFLLLLLLLLPLFSPSSLSLLTLGTGITPMYQLMRAIHADPSDHTEISLLFSNKSEHDLLLFDELNALVGKRFSVWYTITEVKKKSDVWSYSVGYVNEHMMRQHLFEPTNSTIALVCGPPVMVQRACIPNLMSYGYTESNIFEF
jgi:NAD(P)H-flavin reductase